VVKPAASQKRERTREILIQSTLAVVAEKGFDGASLDDIAAHAGMTKGAIYSNYRNKGELLWEAAGRRGLHLSPELRPGQPLVSQARAMARAVMALTRQAEEDAAFLGELQSYIRTDPVLRERQAAHYATIFDHATVQLERDFGDQLAIPARRLLLASQALAWGFLQQWLHSPAEVTEDVVTTAFEALARGAVSAPA
jgi:AcrR family transcriptional regulator